VVAEGNQLGHWSFAAEDDHFLTQSQAAQELGEMGLGFVDGRRDHDPIMN
jgi:hypothetical protein